MTSTYRLYRRNKTFYSEHTETKKQQSLRTTDRGEAQRLLAAMNASDNSVALNRELGRIYLMSAEQELNTRTWRDVMNALIDKHKVEASKHRYEIAAKDKWLQPLFDVKLVETTSAQIFKALNKGTVSTNIYLRRMHNHALGMSWLLASVIPKKMWPPVIHAPKRAITEEEHHRILEREPNQERQLYYQTVWHSGGSQSDVAHLEASDIDWSEMTLSFQRMKLRNKRSFSPALLSIGPEFEKILRQLPSEGVLFPYLRTVRAGDRATEFKQRCEGLGIKGISLHSYRYSWSERAKRAGMPERFAMQALGHNSKAVHRFYSKKAIVVIPSLEDYEQGKVVPFPRPEEPQSQTESAIVG
jgi:integrase